MGRRSEEVVFAEEMIQVATREREEGAWRKEFSARMRRNAREGSPVVKLSLEQAMDIVRDLSGAAKKIDKDAYESVVSQVAEEKDRVSLSQWLVNEGIEMTGVEAPPETLGEQLKDDAIKEMTREPLEREGARARRPYRNWLKHFKNVGDKVGAITLIDITQSEGSIWYYFTHSDYPQYILGINPDYGWRVGTEKGGWSKKMSERVPEVHINEGLIEELLEEGGAKKRKKKEEKKVEPLTQEEKSMAEGILQAYFDMTPEEAQQKVRSESPENIRWLNESHDPYRPLDVDPESKKVRKPEYEPGILSARQIR